MVLLLLWIKSRTVEAVIHVNDATELVVRVFGELRKIAECLLGEVVVAQRSEIFTTIVVMVLHDLWYFLCNVPLRLSGFLPGTLVRGERLFVTNGLGLAFRMLNSE